MEIRLFQGLIDVICIYIGVVISKLLTGHHTIGCWNVFSYKRHHSALSIFSSNSEAFASELLGNNRNHKVLGKVFYKQPVAQRTITFLIRIIWRRWRLSMSQTMTRLE